MIMPWNLTKQLFFMTDKGHGFNQFSISIRRQERRLLFYTFLILGAFVGGFVNGLSGFGTALFALGFFLAIMTPLDAVALIVLMSLFAGLISSRPLLSYMPVNKRFILGFTLPGIVCVPLGVGVLSYISVDMLRLVVAVLLLLYGGYFSLRATLPRITGAFPIMDAVIGAIGGVLGGMGGLSGALPTMWLAMRDFEKHDARAILQAYNMTLLFIAFLVLIYKNAYDAALLLSSVIAIPVAMLATPLGLFVFKKLSTDQFKRLLISMMLISGLVMLARILF